MAKRQTNYSDPLDELLEKLNSGEFVDQSMHEFNEVVKDTVKNYDDVKRKGTSSRYTRSTYATLKPTIMPEFETKTYTSRYEQVTTCLNNLSYNNYPQGKKDGYVEAIRRYLEMIDSHSKDLQPVEIQVNSDINTCQSKLREVTVDGYTQGYYDALLMVKKVLFNSKLARLREISNRLK